MSSAQMKWLQQMCSTIHHMHHTVKSVADSALPQPALQTHLPLMRTLHQMLMTLAQSAPARGMDPCQEMQTDHALFITSFTAFLTVLVPQLERFGARLSLPPCDKPAAATAAAAALASLPAPAEATARAVATAQATSRPAAVTTAAAAKRAEKTAAAAAEAEEDVFWALWRFLVASCVALGHSSTSRPHPFHVQQHALYSPLYSAMQAVLVWLLAMTRSPAWMLMKAQHGLVRRNGELRIVLVQPLNLLNGILSTPLHVRFSHLQSSAKTFLPLVCCILSENIGSAPRVVPRSEKEESLLGVLATSYVRGVDTDMHEFPILNVLNFVAQLVGNCSAMEKQAGNVGRFRFLTAPAVMHLLKAVLLLPTAELLRAPQLVPQTLMCLEACYSIGEQHNLNRPVGPLSTSQGQENRDPLGLPWHLNPCFSSPARWTDMRLLDFISKHIDQAPGLNTNCHGVQVWILMSWLESVKLYPAPPEAVAEIVRGVIGLSQQCMAHLKHAMQHKQWELKGLRDTQPLPARQQPPQEQQQQRIPLKAGEGTTSNLVVLGVKGGHKVRNLIYLASQIRLVFHAGVEREACSGDHLACRKTVAFLNRAGEGCAQGCCISHCFGWHVCGACIIVFRGQENTLSKRYGTFGVSP